MPETQEPEEPEVAASGVAAELIEDLTAEGTHVDEGGFTLDPAKALEQLRAFQLAEREAWVLFLVEAASLAGADAKLACWAGEELTVEFVGPALGAAQLESIFLAPFETTSELEGEAQMVAGVRRYLAMALNAALAIEAPAYEVQTVDANGEGQRLILEPSGEARVEACEGAKPGVIRVLRAGEGVEGQYLSARELDIVRARCRYASFSVSCDGVRVSRGVKAILRPGPQCSITDAAGRTIGVATRDDGAAEGRVLVVVRGVHLETLRSKATWPREFFAAVDLDLPTDLGSSQVLRGPAFDAVLAAIEAAHSELRKISSEWSDPVIVPEQFYLLQVTRTYEHVCTLTGAQLEDLLVLLVRERDDDRDYYIDQAVIEWLAQQGADAELVAELRAFVDRSGPCELAWTEAPLSDAKDGSP